MKNKTTLKMFQVKFKAFLKEEFPQWAEDIITEEEWKNLYTRQRQGLDMISIAMEQFNLAGMDI